MSAVKVIRALLRAAPTVIGIVSDDPRRVVAGSVEQGVPLPAVAVTHVSTVPVGAIDAQAEFGLVVSRVQVTVMGKDYPGVKQLVDAVRKACNYGRGNISDINVVSILRDTVGPDFSNDDATIHFQTIDFKVTFFELN